MIKIGLVKMNGQNRWLNWAVQIECQNKRSKWTVKMEGQNPTVQMEGRNWTGRNRTVKIGLVEIERSKLDWSKSSGRIGRSKLDGQYWTVKIGYLLIWRVMFLVLDVD